jgi:hypothetical protein
LLEVLRQYAAERLAENHEAAETYRQRHAEYFLTFRYQLASGVLLPTSWDVERENANLAAALTWSVKAGRARVRRAARVIVLDPLQRVLLSENEDAVPTNPEDPNITRYWFTPGGGAQLNETFEQAALREETGITDAWLGPVRLAEPICGLFVRRAGTGRRTVLPGPHARCRRRHHWASTA